MKLTWKNKSRDNNKKRTLGSVSIYPNLPFDNQDEASSAQLKAKDGDGDGDDEELGDFNPESLASREPSESSDAKQLAESFQAQGNKLAEVPNYNSFFFSLLLCVCVENAYDWANSGLVGVKAYEFGATAVASSFFESNT